MRGGGGSGGETRNRVHEEFTAAAADAAADAVCSTFEALLRDRGACLCYPAAAPRHPSPGGR